MKRLFKFAKWLDTKLSEKVIAKRIPDMVILATENDVYMERWYIIPRNPIFNIYLHSYTKPDPDYNLHDHPWFSISLVLFSALTEQTIKYGGIFVYKTYPVGSLVFRSPWNTHRISSILGEDCRTLFITGPRIRQWGFHCNIRGWIPYDKYKGAK